MNSASIDYGKIVPEDAHNVWIGRNLYCKTPKGLQQALARLREIGYTIKDLREDSSAIKDGQMTPQELEADFNVLWSARLDQSLLFQAKCRFCGHLMDDKGIQDHGRTCEGCGQVIYLEMTDQSKIRFRFLSNDQSYFHADLWMQVLTWDVENSWLYLKPNPLDGGGIFCLEGQAAREYLNQHADKWQAVEHNGQSAIKIYYQNSCFIDDNSVIETCDISDRYRRYDIVKIWQGTEYKEHDSDFPLPESLSIYEMWRWAPLTPDPTLHEDVIRSAGQTPRVDYYYQDGRSAWNRGHYQIMGKFIKHCTTLSKAEWDKRSPNFHLDGPRGIRDVANFCHPQAEVRDEPNIGNFLTLAGDIMSGKTKFSPPEIKAATKALNDPMTHNLITDIFIPLD